MGCLYSLSNQMLFAPEDPRPVHFMGIAGAGMSALALIARRRGVEDSGCDTDIRGADDYASALLALTPMVAVVTNVEADHLECYGSLGARKAALVESAGRARRVIISVDAAGALRVAARLSVPVWRVGLNPEADVHVK